jgi:hypothetical protein
MTETNITMPDLLRQHREHLQNLVNLLTTIWHIRGDEVDEDDKDLLIAALNRTGASLDEIEKHVGQR